MYQKIQYKAYKIILNKLQKRKIKLLNSWKIRLKNKTMILKIKIKKLQFKVNKFKNRKKD